MSKIKDSLVNKQTIRILINQKCKMRDGTELATDVYLPLNDGKYPTILNRTPYDKANYELNVAHLIKYAQQGYAVVTQDVRGRYGSSGELYAFINEYNDGTDCIEWITEQPWYNGKIGGVGGSYVALTQWQAAQQVGNKFSALLTQVGYSNTYHNWVYTGGAFQLAFNLSWGLAISARTHQRVFMYSPPGINQADLFYHLPLIDIPKKAGRISKHWNDWISHPSYDNYWKNLKPIDENYSSIDTPVLNIGGWYDVFLQGNLNNFMGVQKYGKTKKTRESQKLIVGPWIHNYGNYGSEMVTIKTDFGINSLLDLKSEEKKWYDYWLKGIDNGIMDEPKVKIFVMGINKWREAETWPLPNTKYTPYYIHSKGNANSLFGDGLLNTEKPGKEKTDKYIYDPEHPVITTGGSTCCSEDTVATSLGPKDQRQNEARPDVLVYSTEILEENIEVTGPIKATIYASSDVKDTDFTVKLVDVYPDGYAMNVAQGIQRARYRESWENPSLIEPNKIYKYDIDLWSTSNCFQKGHKIRIEISSSNFPQFDRNPNTGNIFGMDSEMNIANQTIYHDEKFPSFILLPIID